MTDLSFWQANARNEVNAAGPSARLNGAVDYVQGVEPEALPLPVLLPRLTQLFLSRCLFI